MKNSKIAYLYLLLTFFIWGSLYVVSKYVLDKVPVFTVSFLRFFIAGMVMFLLIRRKHLPKIERKDYKYIALVGIVGYFLSIGAQLVGTQLAGASVASLVNSLNPIAILFAAAIILKEPLSWQKIAGVLVQPITSVLLGVLILGEAVTVHMVAGGILIVLGIMFCLVNASQNDKKIQSESV